MDFWLQDNTYVTVRKISKDYFDFEFSLPNGTRRTFRWRKNGYVIYKDHKGKEDALIKEATRLFLEKFSDNSLPDQQP